MFKACSQSVRGSCDDQSHCSCRLRGLQSLLMSGGGFTAIGLGLPKSEINLIKKVPTSHRDKPPRGSTFSLLSQTKCGQEKPTRSDTAHTGHLYHS